MSAKIYGPAFFIVLTIAAFIVAAVTDNKLIFIAGFIFIVMAQMAYLIAYVQNIKDDLENIRQLLIKK